MKEKIQKCVIKVLAILIVSLLAITGFMILSIISSSIIIFVISSPSVLELKQCLVNYGLVFLMFYAFSFAYFFEFIDNIHDVLKI